MALRTMLFFADSVSTISNPTKDVLIKTLGYNKPVAVIPFASTMLPVTYKYDGPDKNIGLRILYAGKLIERKGIKYLLEAIKILAEKRVQFMLILVGDGYLKPEIEKYIRDHSLGPYVEMKGLLPSQSEELSIEFSKCDLFVFPSIVDSRGDTEGLGYVLLDALTFNKPVIASNVGGIPDIIKDNENGYLVPEKDPQALADKIQFVIENYSIAKEAGIRGGRSLSESFSWDVTINKLMAVYANN
jgi:glycosyltransferase involved in cell wall biosynthesis